VVVVDDDIDPTNMKEVLWAMMTRVDPPTNIDIVDGAWSHTARSAHAAGQTRSKDHTNGRAIFYAVRPYALGESFPR
jgi:4-hydroxy-3-polyprenylbenzoate decarboxylase